MMDLDEDTRATRIFTGPVANGRFRAPETRLGKQAPSDHSEPSASASRATASPLHTAPLPRSPAPRAASGIGARSPYQQQHAHERRSGGAHAFAPDAATLRRRKRPSRRGHRGIAIAVAAVAVVLVAIAAARPLIATPVPSSPAAATSTPRSDWHRGAVPYLYQTDDAWADKPYAGGTVRDNGCGPTCLAMVYIALTGNTDRDPAEMARFSEQGGHAVDGMTAWTLMSDGAAELGLASRELPADADAVRGALQNGAIVICSMRPGDFTKTGHFVVLAGLNADGTVDVRDPNSPERSHRSWNLDRVLGQCANLWALSAA